MRQWSPIVLSFLMYAPLAGAVEIQPGESIQIGGSTVSCATSDLPVCSLKGNGGWSGCAANEVGIYVGDDLLSCDTSLATSIARIKEMKQAGICR